MRLKLDIGICINMYTGSATDSTFNSLAKIKDCAAKVVICHVICCDAYLCYPYDFGLYPYLCVSFYQNCHDAGQRHVHCCFCVPYTQPPLLTQPTATVHVAACVCQAILTTAMVCNTF